MNSAVDKTKVSSRYRALQVPCGKCSACLRNKQISWCNRLQLHAKYYMYSHFVTLTYDDYNLPFFSFSTGEIFSLRSKFGDDSNYVVMSVHDYDCDAVPCLDKLDIQRFIKSIKDLCNRRLKTKFSYFLCGEYGMQSYRPHYHLLIFHNSPELYDNIIPTIRQKWNRGNIQVGTCTDASIAYCTKYIMKEDCHPLSIDKVYTDQLYVNEYADIFKNFLLCSKGIGIDYCNEYRDEILKHIDDRDNLHVINNMGYKSSMPRYMKDKLIPTGEWNEYSSIELIDKMQKNEKEQFESWVHTHTNKKITNENRESLFAKWLKDMSDRQVSHKL